MMLEDLANSWSSALLPTVLTISAASWLATTAMYAVLIVGAQARRRSAALRLAENAVIWLFLLLVLLFVYYSAGSAYTNHTNIILQSVFMAMGFAFAGVSAPLFVARAIRRLLRSGGPGAKGAKQRQ